MADLNVCKAPDGRQHCILKVSGIRTDAYIYPVTKIGGMVHYMLPDIDRSNNSNKAKFADKLPRIIKKKSLLQGQVRQGLLPVLLARVSGLSDVGNIGARNAEAAKKILKEKTKSRLVAEDTGLNYGRTGPFCYILRISDKISRKAN